MTDLEQLKPYLVELVKTLKARVPTVSEARTKPILAEEVERVMGELAVLSRQEGLTHQQVSDFATASLNRLERRMVAECS